MAEKQVIPASVEKNVRKIAREIGFTDTPLKSMGTHNIELSIIVGSKKEYAYISRFTGIPKNEFQIVIRPEFDTLYAEQFLRLSSIRSSEKDSSNGKLVQGSQYPGFQNKLSQGEFRGRAWRMPISSGLTELRSFLSVFKPELVKTEISLDIENHDNLSEKNVFPDEVQEVNEVHIEGAKRQVIVNAYERSPLARKKCIEAYGATCMACNFDFEAKYGEIGKGFIHVHHIVPLEEVDKEYIVNPVEDLVPLCPNCHAMVHKQKPPYSLAELVAIMNKA